MTQVYFAIIFTCSRCLKPQNFAHKLAKKGDFLKNNGHDYTFLYTRMMVMGSHEAGGLLTSHDHLFPFFWNDGHRKS